MKTETAPLGDLSGPEIGRHDQDRVLEIDHPPVVVREVPFVQHLEQYVEHVWMCLFDLVEKNHGVRTTPDRLRKGPGILITHISGGRADQPRHRELLHVLAHVHTDESFPVVEKKFRQRPSELRLPHPRRSGENEGSDRAIRVFQAGTASSDGSRDRLYGIVLADHPLVDLVLHVDQALGLGRLELGHRDPGPTSHDKRDVLGLDFGAVLLTLLLPLLLFDADSILKRALLVPEFGGSFEILISDGPFLQVGDLGEFFLQALDLRGRHLCRDAGARTRLVDDVDGFVG